MAERRVLDPAERAALAARHGVDLARVPEVVTVLPPCAVTPDPAEAQAAAGFAGAAAARTGAGHAPKAAIAARLAAVAQAHGLCPVDLVHQGRRDPRPKVLAARGDAAARLRHGLGLQWGAIGRALGTSGQTAWHWYRRRRR